MDRRVDPLGENLGGFRIPDLFSSGQFLVFLLGQFRLFLWFPAIPIFNTGFEKNWDSSCLRPDTQKLSAGTWTFDLCSLLYCGQWPHYTHTHTQAHTRTHTHALDTHTHLNKPAAEIWIPTMRGVRCVNRRYQKTNWEEVATRGEQPAQQRASICLDMSESTGGVPEWIVSVSSVQTSFVGCSPLNILHSLCTPASN